MLLLFDRLAEGGVEVVAAEDVEQVGLSTIVVSQWVWVTQSLHVQTLFEGIIFLLGLRRHVAHRFLSLLLGEREIGAGTLA